MTYLSDPEEDWMSGRKEIRTVADLREAISGVLGEVRVLGFFDGGFGLGQVSVGIASDDVGAYLAVDVEKEF